MFLKSHLFRFVSSVSWCQWKRGTSALARDSKASSHNGQFVSDYQRRKFHRYELQVLIVDLVLVAILTHCPDMTIKLKPDPFPTKTVFLT